MGRLCTICKLPERLTIDSRLRAGESRAQLAVDYGVSTDALDRHAARHLDQAQLAKSAENTTEWDEIVMHSKELLATSISAGDTRAALASLGRLSDAIASRDAAARNKSRSAFESLSAEEKAERICANPQLVMAVLNHLVRDTGRTFVDHVKICEDQIREKTATKHGQLTDSQN